MKLTKKIIIALLLGAITGLVLNMFTPTLFTTLDSYVFYPLGKIFTSSIQMLVVPMVLFSIILGTTGLGDPKKLGKIGLKTVAYFLITTAIAITIGMTLATIISPGTKGSFDIETATYEVTEAPAVTDTLLNIIPSNPFAALAEGNMLQIIVMAVLIGTALTALGEKTKGLVKLVEQGNDLMMYLVHLVMRLAPYGTFGLIATAVGSQGLSAMKAMSLYMIVVILALIVHGVVTYGGTIALLAKKSPIWFVKNFTPAISVAFSTSSSSATLPISMEIAQEKLGVKESVSSFVQPLGATINMDGTAIMQGVATIFIAQVYGIDLGMTEMLTVVLTAVLASIGTAGVPGVGLIMLAMVLSSVGLPVEGIGLILGIDRLTDMARTALNITGDAACALLISEQEKSQEVVAVEKDDLETAI